MVVQRRASALLLLERFLTDELIANAADRLQDWRGGSSSM